LVYTNKPRKVPSIFDASYTIFVACFASPSIRTASVRKEHFRLRSSYLKEVSIENKIFFLCDSYMSCPTILSNQVGEIRGVESEVACQLACREELDCHYFTWVRWVLCTHRQIHLRVR
jgi:hypothetical protein